MTGMEIIIMLFLQKYFVILLIKGRRVLLDCLYNAENWHVPFQILSYKLVPPIVLVELCLLLVSGPQPLLGLQGHPEQS